MGVELICGLDERTSSSDGSSVHGRSIKSRYRIKDPARLHIMGCRTNLIIYQWKRYAAGAIVSAGEKALLDEAEGAGFTAAYVRGIVPTWSSGTVTVILNALV